MLNPLEMERYIHAIAKRADLQVRWEDVEKPRTDGKAVMLPRMTAGITELGYQRLRHFVAHEVGHVLYSDMALLQRTGLGADKSLLGALWNLIEDQRIEFLGSSEYEGDRLCGDAVYPGLVEGMVGSAATVVAKDGENEMVDTIMPAVAWDNLSHADFFPSAAGMQRQIETPLSAKAQECYAKFKAADYSDVLRNIRTIQDKEEGTQATLDLASRIFEEVYGGDAKKEIERTQKEAAEKRAAEGKGKGKPKKGDGEGKGEGQGESGEGGEEKDKRTEFASVDYSPLMADAHMAGESRAGLHINYDNHVEQDNYIPAPGDSYHITDYANTPTREGYYQPEINKALGNTSSGFAHRVRTILQIRDKDNYRYGQKRGKLHNSALYRVTMKEAKGFNERVFKQKQVNNVLDASVTLLVDQSGSMGGDKYSHAAAAAVMLNDTIGNTLHIPTEIASFSSGYHSAGGPSIYLHRRHGDKLVPRDLLIQRLSSSAESMGGNGDGDALMWVFDRIRQRTEKRKLIIVFSDGQPTDGNGDPVYYLKKVVKGIEQESAVDIVGIGIMDRNVAKFYKEHYVIKQAAELEQALLSVIENKLK